MEVRFSPEAASPMNRNGCRDFLAFAERPLSDGCGSDPGHERQRAVFSANRRPTAYG
jgi:hypothetical protein